MENVYSEISRFMYIGEMLEMMSEACETSHDILVAANNSYSNYYDDDDCDDDDDDCDDDDDEEDYDDEYDND